ncbi:MAG: response regulator, partial [Methyloprofundus sp.]|nr:response regulator [Methyloprofundus sp.]
MGTDIEHALSRIQELQQAFSEKLAARIHELCQATLELDNRLSVGAKNNRRILKNTHDLAHKLAGAAGTFQFTDVYNSAKNLEHFCSILLDPKTPYPKDWFIQIQQLLIEIKQLSKNKKQPPVVKDTPTKLAIDKPLLTSNEHKIILVDDDELLSSLIQQQTKNFGYQISCINTPESVSDFLDGKTPDVILMDIIFPHYPFNGIDLIKQLKAENKIHCPVIFLSNREDFGARLEAVRAGGSGYLVKPVNILELVETLDRYSKKNSHEDFRALIIDDDVLIADFYKKLLRPQGFSCKSIANPFEAITTLIAFRPDIILLDINMPDCNGLEVAAVIRQDNRFTHIPILFLTSESGDEREIAALKAGGDYFLSKNTNTEMFVTNIISHSQRSKELHKVIDRLRKDEVRFQAVSHSTSDAIITLNKEGRIILWNQGAEHIFGYQAIETIGQTIDIIIPQQNALNFQKIFADNQQQKRRSSEVHALTKEQKHLFIELSYTEWFSGNERFFTTIIRDITQRKKTENKLKNQQENLKAIVTNSVEGIITIDDKGIIEMINPGALEMFSYRSKKELLGQNISLLMHKDMRQKHDEYLQHSKLNEPRIFNKAMELKGLRKDGSLFPIELSVSPMTINGAKKYVGILHDVTEDQKNLDAIIAAKLEAEKANREKSLFLSSMSHELRTPLNAILGFTQLLLEDTEARLNEDQSESMEYVNSAGHHLLKLIDEILDLSRIESGKVDLNFEKINLVDFIQQSLRLHSPQAQKAQIEFNDKLSAEEMVFVKADSFRLNQVLSNLLSNAIKYNKPHGVISIWLSQSDNNVRFFVKDTGKGIPDNMIKDLFKPFNRLGADQSGIEGTGIGLTITKKLVEMMGGTIGLENSYGKGCTFWVELQQAELSEQAQVISALSIDAKSNAQQAAIVKVLYIEDNAVNRLLMKKIISSHTDYQYHEAFTGSEGIQAALKIKPQIILLD